MIVEFGLLLAVCVAAGGNAYAEEMPTRESRRREALAALLERKGVKATSESARDYLLQHLKGNPLHDRLHSLLNQLGSENPVQRQAAEQTLVDAPWVPAGWLARVAQGEDLEAAWRARRVRDRAGPRHDQMLRAAFVIAALPSQPEAPPGNPPPSPAASANQPPLNELIPRLTSGDDEPALVSFLERVCATRGGLADEELPEPERVYDRGRVARGTLVATGQRGLAGEWDDSGESIRRIPLAAWSAERRVNGHTLLASLDEQRVVEVDDQTRVTWEYGPVSALRAKPLPRGHVLLADHGGQRALEVNREGTVVWAWSSNEPCLDVERLSCGNTLVATANQVFEVTPDGKTVWKWSVQGRVNGIQALGNGQLLVANFGAGEVQQLDDSARVVRRWKEPQPSDAFRLPDGSTLVATAQRIVEFDADGVMRRVITTARYGSARR